VDVQVDEVEFGFLPSNFYYKLINNKEINNYLL
jgi:hypothetical protein